MYSSTLALDEGGRWDSGPYPREPCLKGLRYSRWGLMAGNVRGTLSIKPRSLAELRSRRSASGNRLPPTNAQGLRLGGQQALRAIGEYEQGGKQIAELLTWIFTEHTRTFFFAKTAAQDLPSVQAPFERMLQSARIP